MDFKEELEALGRKSQSLAASLSGKTEEASKMALVMPFIQALGYNVFDPTEVAPEYSAAIGDHKDARVDYAILKDGNPIIIVECKAYGSELKASQCNQLMLYFHGTSAKIAILTDGDRYMFFSDLEETNKMDSKPYMEFCISKIDEALVPELKKLTKGAFDPDDAMTSASELKYTREFKRIFAEQIAAPDEDFLKYFLKTKKVYDGVVTQRVIEQLTPVLKRALAQFIQERINQRLSDALSHDEDQPTDAPPEPPVEPEEDGIVTTEDEWAAYYIVKAILAGTVDDVSRVQLNDYKTCCNICLDKKQQYLVRLYFNKKPYAIELFDTAGDDDKKEKIPVDKPDDLYQFAARIKTTAQAILAK